MSRLRKPLRHAVTLILLFAVVWGRAWAGVPHAPLHHHDAGHGQAHAETCGIDVTVSGLAHQHEPDHHEPHYAADASGEGQHEHHVHVCTLGGHAIACETQLKLDDAKLVFNRPAGLTVVVRRHERLLRPPQA